jgi:hypothetical protein
MKGKERERGKDQTYCGPDGPSAETFGLTVEQIVEIGNK